MFYFGVRRPGLWESRTVYIFCTCLFTVSAYDVVDGYFLIGVVVGAAILIFIRIIGGRDWPGVGNGVPICICC